MTRNSFVHILIFFAGLGLFSACQNETDEHEHDETNHAEIQVDSPAEGAVYAAGDTVFLRGNLIGEQSLHGYALSIRNQADSTLLFDADVHEHGLELQMDTFWVHTLPAAADLQLQIEVYIDHDGHADTLQRSFHCEAP